MACERRGQGLALRNELGEIFEAVRDIWSRYREDQITPEAAATGLYALVERTRGSLAAIEREKGALLPIFGRRELEVRRL